MATRQLRLVAPHNNQQLFSDHYLNEKLPEHPRWRALATESEPVRVAIARILDGYHESSNEAQTERDLVRPVLEALGHIFEVQVALRTPDGTKTPDYVFYRNEAGRQANKNRAVSDDDLRTTAYAVGDAKHWDRKLDVALKGASGDPFSNRNPSYQIAFYIQHSGVEWGILTNGRLWRLYHRASAHKLDRFYEVDLPELVKHDTGGFLYFYAFFRRAAFEPGDFGVAEMLKESADYARGVSNKLKLQVFEALRHLAQGFLDYPANQLTPDDETLKSTYDNALILLYRLLFILYAEARELLPVRGNPSYRDAYSLYALTHQIAENLRHGNLLLPTSALNWPRLLQLFEIINKGSPPLNVATFNGGLFDPARHPFLARYTVGDAHLQQAIDILARVDEQFVDYRDLAEYHLGSIYEGLLEYHLAAIEPEDGWTVALENEKGERKQTGSYYTPNYIVKYIVEQTLGPLLRAAITDKASARAKVDAILGINVVDPAMGSGYFLVEATEQIARFLVDQGLAPDTPEVDEADLAYWKRRVVQSCVYGVDINPLAVDLAKLSLWLGTVAKDKPLSFLDHHLRAGNSVVGARIAELRRFDATPKKKRKATRVAHGAPAQISMLDNDQFRQSMSTAVDSMWLIERSAGNTVDDVKQQEQVYAQLHEDLTRRYGRLADLVTATHFGLEIDPTLWTPLADFATGRTIAPLPIFTDWLTRAEELDAEHHFFHWELEFPEVFFDRHGESRGDQSGFDAVIGNPPYVRQERLKVFKPYYEAKYSNVYTSTADLFVLFFACGIDLLQCGGRLSFISSNSWLRASYAERLRAYLRTNVTIETLVNLGDNRVFLSAPDTYPVISVLRKADPPADHSANVAIFARDEGVRDFDAQVADKLFPVSIHDQQDSGWQLASSVERALLTRLVSNTKSLGDVNHGRLHRGILTGLNPAFIVDQLTHGRLVADDAASRELLRPVLRGEDLRPWFQEDEGNWLIVIPSGWTRSQFGPDIDESRAWSAFALRYPAVARHLQQFEADGRKRQDQGEFWWELRACDYYGAFETPKIMWPDIAKFPRFSWDDSGYYLGNTGYILVTDEPWILAFLSSRCAWYLISQTSIALGERAGINRYRLIDQYMRPLPVPDPTPSDRDTLGTLAESITKCAKYRRQLHERTRQRILSDLGSADGKLNTKLTAWWELDFSQFRAEIQKVFKHEIPLRERDEWEAWLSERRAEHERYTAEIIRLETMLNERVYALFDLTADEIKLIEESTKYRYGEV